MTYGNKKALCELLHPSVTAKSPRHKEYSRTRIADCQIRDCLMLMLFLLLHGVPATAEPAAIVGRWKIDSVQSTEASDELKGIRVSKRKKKDSSPPPSSRPGGAQGQGTQQRYWEEANAGKEWRHTNELAHAGPLQRLLESENLEIVPADDGYVFIYADGYERKVIPNPGGRVFTASGDELVHDNIGHTLAYWKGDELRLETRIKGGGKLRERVSTSPDGARLKVNIEIDRRDWKWIAKLDRLFDRVATSP